MFYKPKFDFRLAILFLVLFVLVAPFCMAGGLGGGGISGVQRGIEISGYTRSNVLYIKNTHGLGNGLSDSMTSGGAIESFGPNGSGADNIWSELDALPSNTAGLYLNARITCDATASPSASAIMRIRKEGESMGGGTFYFSTETTGQVQINQTAWVAVNSTKTFDMNYSVTNCADVNVFDITIIGFTTRL